MRKEKKKMRWKSEWWKDFASWLRRYPGLLLLLHYLQPQASVISQWLNHKRRQERGIQHVNDKKQWSDSVGWNKFHFSSLLFFLMCHEMMERPWYAKRIYSFHCNNISQRQLTYYNSPFQANNLIKNQKRKKEEKSEWGVGLKQGEIQH